MLTAWQGRRPVGCAWDTVGWMEPPPSTGRRQLPDLPGWLCRPLPVARRIIGRTAWVVPVSGRLRTAEKPHTLCVPRVRCRLKAAQGAMPALSGGLQARGVTAPRSLLESLLRSRQALRWNLPTPGDSDCGLSVVSPDRVPTQVLLPPAGFPACTVRLYNIGG